MGVLVPLYLAGLTALSLPLILHLVRRTPRGRQEFSSLMFLSPTPPRLTRLHPPSRITPLHFVNRPIFLLYSTRSTQVEHHYFR